MQAQNGANVAALQLLFLIRVGQESEERALHAQRRLDAVGQELFARGGIEVFHGLAGMLLMLLQIVVRAVGHAPQLAPAEREQVFKVGGRLGIERQLVLLVVAQAQMILLHAQRKQPVAAEGTPVVEPLKVRAGHAEEFQLHLLEFQHAEDEVTGRDFVAEGLANLRDARRKLLARGAHDVLEVDEDALRGLRAQIQLGGGVLVHALMGLEHQVELTDAGKVLLAAHGALDVVLGDVGLQLLVRPAVAGLLAAGEVLNQLVRAEARLARLAVHQRVVEAAHVTGRHPHLAVHQNAAVHAGIVRAFLHKLAPPRLFDVVLHFHAQRAEVPRVGQSAVDLRSGEDKALVFAQRDEFIHRDVCHPVHPSCSSKDLNSFYQRSRASSSTSR